ncbi:MAG TPA: recombinase family protein, partial [Gemmataceae bacterium]|nr:recombinase family protein [Gemmataceae bacterium]
MTAKPGSPAAAYSYIRFSSPEQRRGDSVRRQTEAAQAWCDRNNARLDASTTLHDLGTSAFRGAHRKNPDRNALAAFLKLVEDGKVPRGSFLVIESLDRLTREHIRPALTLLLNLIEAGVRIVQLKPVEVVYDEDVEPMQLMMALMELSRGNSESRVKSERIGAAWVTKREQARNGKLLTRNLPAWVRIVSIERDSYRLALIPERAEVVARIFRLAACGLGTMRICQKLTEEGVPAFGRQMSEKAIADYEDRRRADGKPPLTDEDREALRRPGYWHRGERRAPAWNRGYVTMILRDRRALGEYLPRARRRLDDGKPIANYYPAVVDQDTFNAARAAVAQRKTRTGRGGVSRRVGRHVFLFSGLIFDAVDGNVYHAGTRTENRAPRYYDAEGKRRRGAAEPGREKRNQRHLVNAAAGEGRLPRQSFPLATFERAILSKLREIDSREVLGETSPAADVVSLERQVRWLADRQAELAAELRNGDIPVIAQQIREIKAEEDEVAARLEEARQLAAKPLSETWGDLSGLVEAAADPDARRRLRSAIGRIIEKIQLLVVPRGRDRLAYVEVRFAGGAGPRGLRNYVIVHRPPLWTGKKGMRPGAWWCASARHLNAALAYQWSTFRGDELVEDDDPIQA